MGSEGLDGVLIVAPDGERIGFIQLPERCANVCFGGLKRNRLFMAASQSSMPLRQHAGSGRRMSVHIRHAVAEDRDICIDFIGTLNGGPVLQSWHETFDALIDDTRAVSMSRKTTNSASSESPASPSISPSVTAASTVNWRNSMSIPACGKNCGGLLLQAVIDGARDRGCTEVGLYITHRHAANRPFYEKFGFEDVGIEVRQNLTNWFS